MRILIVDDSIDKISELSKLIYDLVPNAQIQTSENISNAIILLSENETYNLLVVDLLLPLRLNDEPRKDGGKMLLSEIYRKKTMLKVPNYIVGFSQLKESEYDFSNIWNVIKYSYESVDWKTSFKFLINHIVSTNLKVYSVDKILPTIIVEGLTDKYYLEKAIELFYNDYMLKVEVSSQKNAGANWVANQIPLWAMKLNRDVGGRYIKAVGLLDSDEAGIIAKQKVDNRNLTDNEKQCCSYFQLKPNYNSEVLLFYQNSCKIEIEIETLFPIEVLKHAESQSWLEYRTKTFIDAPSDWKQHEETSIQYISKKEIPEENLLYLKKVKIGKKEDFCMYVDSLDNKELAFSNFKILVGDLLKKIDLLE